jgi:amino acid transporter
MKKLKDVVLGSPRDIHDPGVFHKISLVAFMAWVGLGADGLSSSAYGPDEAFRALGEHTELAVLLALATAFTVFVISYAYSRIIEHFPHGGGGYLVATKLLGPKFGVVSGSALLVDYILTITVSIASGASQIFSFLPIGWQQWMVPMEGLVIVILIVLNLRGAKESIAVLTPIFLLFLVTHAVVIFGSLFLHGSKIPELASHVTSDLHNGFSTLGFGAMFLLFARAYSRGAGTYTGIEAVSNGIQIMREPKIETAKRTMVYMALSLAITAGAILLIYLLLGVREEPGKTLNAVMVERMQIGPWFVVLTLCAEAALLFVAAQTGFIDGPRVMANMALDSWLPHRFSALSERLTLQYGIALIGGASILTLLYTQGNVDALVTMYSINVFITFSLTEMGMVRFWITERKTHPEWKRSLPIHMIGLVLCLSILTVVVVEKFEQGAWMTVVITSGLIALCSIIRKHYRTVAEKMTKLSQDLDLIPTDPLKASSVPPVDPSKPVAILLVGSFGGLGIHSLLTIFHQFPDYFKQVVFVSIAVLDSGSFKGSEEIERLEEETREGLEKYVAFTKGLGVAATSAMAVGMEAVEESEKLCTELARQYPRATFFAGKLIFQREKWYQRLLHNETATAVQRRLQWVGIPTVILPVRVREA